jgi:hypothetical protein
VGIMSTALPVAKEGRLNFSRPARPFVFMTTKAALLPVFATQFTGEWGLLRLWQPLRPAWWQRSS